MDRPWERLAALTGKPVGEDEWREALSQHRVLEERWDDLRYYRIEKDLAHLPRGTILGDDRVVRDFPHMGRILHVARGLARSFGGPFHIEEKIDGYNARIARVSGRTLAFSRGGYVCPFTTDRLADQPEIGKFLEAHPRLVVCVEVAGPNNPYNVEHPPYVTDDIRFFAIDLAEIDTGRFVLPARRAALLAEAGIPAPRSFGTALPREAARVYEVVRALDAEGCEGVVLKSADDPDIRVKYVTLGSDLRDLAATAGLLGSIPRAFFVNRVVQAAFALHEIGGGSAPDEFCRGVGHSLLAPMLESIRAVEGPADPERQPGDVEEVYEVRLREEVNAERLLRHLDRSTSSVQVKLLKKERTPDGRWRVSYLKRYQRATGYFLSRLIGQTFVD